MTMQADTFDVVEITSTSQALSLGYDGDERGLKVQVEGEWLADAVNLDEARAIVAKHVGRGQLILVTAEPDGLTGARRWTAS